MDGEHDLKEGLEELAERNSRLVDGEEDETREERGSEVDTQLLQEIMYSLESVSIGTHQLLYFSALKYAGNYLKCGAGSVEEAVEELSEVFDSMNLGGLEMRDGGDPVEVELSENALTHSSPDSGRAMCYFVSGYIAGFLENCLDRRFVVNETRCSAEGNESCVFQIQER